jgi:hypothetical protein
LPDFEYEAAPPNKSISFSPFISLTRGKAIINMDQKNHQGHSPAFCSYEYFGHFPRVSFHPFFRTRTAKDRESGVTDIWPGGESLSAGSKYAQTRK